MKPFGQSSNTDLSTDVVYLPMNTEIAESTNVLSEEREKISAFVICYNEESEIEDCLSTLDFCDEVVVIDSFSTDRTVELCEATGARVIQRDWPGYRAQKAFGLSATEHGWVLNIDADERVSPELRADILKVLQRKWLIRNGELNAQSDEPDGYEVNRVVFYLGRWWRKGGWYPEYRVRFFRKEKVEWGGTDPHEKPIVDGPISRLSGELQHYTYRSLDEQIRRLHAHATIAAQEEAKRNREVGLRHLLLNPLVRMFKFYVSKRGYREGTAGIIVAIMEGFYTFVKYAKLWEISHSRQEQSGS